MVCCLELPPKWVDAAALDEAMRAGGGPHNASSYEVTIRFPLGCKVMLDAAIRLLSLANQLDFSARRVRLEFDEGDAGTMGYLNRMGFFDHLAPGVVVVPGRPVLSSAKLHRGGNARLVEIARITKNERDKSLPSRLSDAVAHACSARADVKQLEGAAWTIFAELIDNVFSHSQTPLDGYAALQVYPRGDQLQVAVSDSGLGIMQTLRPSLASEFPALVRLSDVELIVEVFRQGLSRHGADRGCGLRGSAAKAIKFRAELEVRLPNSRVRLTPARGNYEPNMAYSFDRLPLIWGTHIGFTFRLAA